MVAQCACAWHGLFRVGSLLNTFMLPKCPPRVSWLFQPSGFAQPNMVVRVCAGVHVGGPGTAADPRAAGAADEGVPGGQEIFLKQLAPYPSTSDIFVRTLSPPLHLGRKVITIKAPSP